MNPSSAKSKPKATPQRPRWISYNKIMLALHWLADNKGLVEVDSVSVIARASGVHGRVVRSALDDLYYDGKVDKPGFIPGLLRVQIVGFQNGSDLAKQLIPPKMKITKKSVGPRPVAEPLPSEPPAIEPTVTRVEATSTETQISPQATQLKFKW